MESPNLKSSYLDLKRWFTSVKSTMSLHGSVDSLECASLVGGLSRTLSSAALLSNAQDAHSGTHRVAQDAVKSCLKRMNRLVTLILIQAGQSKQVLMCEWNGLLSLSSQ